MSDYYSYQEENIIASSVSPSMLHFLGNANGKFFQKYLFEKVKSVFKWTLPETWNSDYFQTVLYGVGYVCVFDTGVAQFGVIPQLATLSGYNIFYAPKYALVSNPLLPNFSQLEIGTDCELVRLQSNFSGVLDLVNYYAAKMAALASAIDTNTINSKLAYVFASQHKTAAETFKKLYDKVASGEPAVFLDKSLYNEDGTEAWKMFTQNLKQNYLVSDMLLDLRKLEQEFCTRIGIPTANIDKRERLNSDEVHANDTETAALADRWLERVQDGLTVVNKRYNLNCSVEWRYKPDESYFVPSGDVQL